VSEPRSAFKSAAAVGVFAQ